MTITKINIASYFLELPCGDVHIVAWPIWSVKLLKADRFLRDLVEEVAHDSDESL